MRHRWLSLTAQLMNRRPRRAARPALHPLEERIALSLTEVGSQLNVSSSLGTPPAVAKDSAGDFVVAYESVVYTNGSPSQYNIVAQRYNASDQAQGSPITVNGSQAAERDSPTVAMDSAGDFVVGWHVNYKFFTDQPWDDVYAQRFNAQGQAQGSAIHVNQVEDGGTVTTAAYLPKVAMDPDGEFDFTYSRVNAGIQVWDRLYSSSGSPITNEFEVDATNGDASKPWVAMDGSGDFVVTWGVGVGGPNNPGLYAVYFQRYNSSGQAVGSKTNTGNETRDEDDANRGPAVSRDSTGDFVVTWANLYSSSTQSTEEGVYFEIFNSSGAVTKSTTAAWDAGHPISGDQSPPIAPTVAMDPTGEWAVTWDEPVNATWNVYVRQYNLAGTAQTSALQVDQQSPYHGNKFQYADIATDSNGDVSIAWTSRNVNGNDAGDWADSFTAGASPAIVLGGSPSGPVARLNPPPTTAPRPRDAGPIPARPLVVHDRARAAIDLRFAGRGRVIPQAGGLGGPEALDRFRRF